MFRFTPRLLASACGLAAAAAFAAPQYSIEALPDTQGAHVRTASAINQKGAYAVTNVPSLVDKKLESFIVNGPFARVLPLEAPGDYPASVAAINRYGASVGSLGDQAAAWEQDGSLTNISERMHCARGSATGVNDAGLIVGHYSCFDQATFSWRDGSFTIRRGKLTDWKPVDGRTPYFHGVNNAGQIVGRHGGGPNETAPYHATIWQRGVAPKDLGTLGGASSDGYAINEAGHAVGISQRADGNWYGFFHDGAAMRELGCENKTATPVQLNAHDQIVGTIDDDDGTVAGLLVDQGQCHRFSTLLDASGAGWAQLAPSGINDAGVIVGAGYLNGRVRAFKATPVKR